MDSPLTNSKLSNDKTLQTISRTFIKPAADLCFSNNKFIEKFKQEFIKKLKETDPDFGKCTPHIKACGSYYKKTKVGKPDEYDLNLILNLPLDYSKCEISTDKRLPGFVKICVKNAYTEKWKQTSLEKKITDPKSGCLDQEKFRRWIESLITKAAMQRTQFVVEDIIYTLQFVKSGPAQTANVYKGNMFIMSIDFVPCLEFQKNLPGFYVCNEYNGPMIWLAVPKLYRFSDSRNNLPLETNLFWRTSFYAYEAKILRKKNNCGIVNDVIRFMKKMRSTHNWDSKLPSYYLETLFFNEIEIKKTSFEGRSRTQIFVYMLHVLRDCMKNKRIEFFWNRNFNLLENHKENTLTNFSGKISRMIDNINKNINNYHSVIASIILTELEYDILMRPDFEKLADNQKVATLGKQAEPSWCVLS